ncbi:MAG: ATP-binding protein, partial [Oscillospiraceae bacterium]|nr:ATP-binding protein [Oscillospiraceae bacterium]
ARLFGLSSKQEYLDTFFLLSPEFQPDGSPSSERAAELVREAFDVGYLQFEWMHQNLDKEQIPCEITLIRIKEKDDYIVAGYTRDIRKLKAAIADMEKAVEEKTALSNLGIILNGLDAMICVTDAKTREILFINDYMKQHYDVTEDVVGQTCCSVIQKGEDDKCAFCPHPQLDENPDTVVVWEEKDPSTDRAFRNVARYITWPSGQTVYVRHSVDITELIDAKEYAEHSNRSKDVFLAHMSHEIRTPMNAILGVSEMQLFNKDLPTEQRDGFVRVYESGNLLLNIINDILDFSKIDAEKMEITPHRYEFPSMLNDAVQLNRLHNENKPLDFFLKVDENIPYELLGDELRIKQIVSNILSNAFKYTESGEIVLSLSVEPGYSDETVNLIFKVSDTGQGMGEEQIATLFDEYTRFNLEENRSISGTGLGMNITKRLVDKMNGKISVESEIGKGSVFTVILPQKKFSPAVCGSEIAESLMNFNYHNASISRKIRLIHEYMPYGSVLIVDDIESNLYVAKGLMTPYGLRIDTAKSGEEAIEKVRLNGEYDVIFMDHMMPKMDGIQATAILRGMGYTLPIVALTANAVSGQAEMFLSSGFDGFISKPIDLRELDLSLTNFVRDRKPPEIVEAAVRERRASGAVAFGRVIKSPVSEPSDELLSELKEYFVLDAEGAIDVLNGVLGSTHTLNDADWESYTITVHGIKSALTNIGEGLLSEEARVLENEGKARNFEAVISGTPHLIEGLKKLIDEFKPKNTETAATDCDYAYLREKLRSIKEACEAFDKKAAKSALMELREKTWPNDTTGLLDDISLKLLHGELKKVASIIDCQL